MAVGDVYEVVPTMQTAIQVGLNVLHYRVTAQVGASLSDLVIANALDGQFRAFYRSVISSSSQFEGVKVKKLLPAPASAGAFSTTGQESGLATGDPLPRQVSGIITKKTDFSGRRFRGRLYIPFPAEPDSTSNAVPIGSYVIALAALGNALKSPGPVISGPDSMTFALCILHKRTSTNDLVTSTLARAVWATQRRRGSYGRPNPDPTPV